MTVFYDGLLHEDFLSGMKSVSEVFVSKLKNGSVKIRGQKDILRNLTTIDGKIIPGSRIIPPRSYVVGESEMHSSEAGKIARGLASEIRVENPDFKGTVAFTLHPYISVGRPIKAWTAFVWNHRGKVGKDGKIRFPKDQPKKLELLSIYIYYKTPTERTGFLRIGGEYDARSSATIKLKERGKTVFISI